MQQLQENYHQAKLLWQSQKEDDELEQQVIQSVQERREPARQIAKRRKQQGRPVGSNNNEGEDDEAMATGEQPEGRQAMEDALMAWNHGMILPMQVALEVTANLLTCLIQDENDMAIEKDNDSLDQALFLALASVGQSDGTFGSNASNPMRLSTTAS
jgi:hypothetical protein